MANRTTSTDRVLIDPIFGVPVGAEDTFAYSRENSDTEETVDSQDVLAIDSGDDFDDTGSDGIEFDDGYDDSNGVTLETPEDFIILSQTLRRAPGGQQVVDLVIEVEDIAGATNYEIQVTKV